MTQYYLPPTHEPYLPLLTIVARRNCASAGTHCEVVVVAAKWLSEYQHIHLCFTISVEIDLEETRGKKIKVNKLN